MNKRILIPIFLILIITGSLAFYINETITQTSYNQINFSELDLNLNVTNTWIENDRLFVEFEYNTFENVLDENGVDTNTWVFTTKTDRIPYYLGLYRTCREDNNIEVCNANIISFIYEQSDYFKSKERLRLDEQKTKQLVDEISITNFKDLYINYDLYKVGVAYSVGDIFVYDNELYEVLQAHTSQLDWVPSSVPALYKIKVLGEEGEIREWVQPTGAHDAYNIGDKVLFNGLVYESLINANVWSPTAYPAGWKLV